MAFTTDSRTTDQIHMKTVNEGVFAQRESDLILNAIGKKWQKVQGYTKIQETCVVSL